MIQYISQLSTARCPRSDEYLAQTPRSLLSLVLTQLRSKMGLRPLARPLTNAETDEAPPDVEDGSGSGGRLGDEATLILLMLSGGEVGGVELAAPRGSREAGMGRDAIPEDELDRAHQITRTPQLDENAHAPAPHIAATPYSRRHRTLENAIALAVKDVLHRQGGESDVAQRRE
ncbi:hypothetical protein C8R45DRAFT_1019641, partial [Mycena sanguinolenta]